VEILKDLFFIERGYLNANHFVFCDLEPVLIDTGYIRDFDETERLIEGLGVDLKQTRRIICTHTHCDHIGGNSRIQEQSGCEIALHRIGKHYIDRQDDWSTWWRYYGQEAEFFKCSMGLEHGDEIQVGPHRFEVIHTPGHASDGMVLYNRKDKVLISSDTLWENDLAVITPRVEGSAAVFAALESLQKLEGLQVEAVYPGHGRPFTDMAAALEHSRRKYQGYLQEPARMADDQLKRIFVYTLLMYRRLSEDELFMRLMAVPWYQETVDLFFSRDYEGKFGQIISGLLDKGVVQNSGSGLTPLVKA
jgi:glyoxylase-like metal-dependent hydrolase (beta-lactamase superfamily II)